MANKTDSQEYEVKVVDIDVDEIVKKLRELGAEETQEVLMKRWVFDFNPQESKFIRLRDNGNGITTLTYKHRPTYELGDTEEIEVVVEDFEKTAQILKKLDINKVDYQENKRRIFKLNDIEFSIDTWPHLKPHLEVESFNKEKVLEGLKLLDLEGKDIGNLTVVELYEEIGINLNDIRELKFP